MKISDVRRTAYAMPLTNPAFPRGPYRFFDREHLIVTYRTDLDALRAVVPEPLEVVEQREQRQREHAVGDVHRDR